MSDDDIDRLKRGGHDPLKIYAAYHAAGNHRGQPTVVLAQTKKGYGMGTWGQGRMGGHQQKKLDDAALREFRDRFSLPISDDDVAQLRFFNPGPDSPEIKYLEARRRDLGGPLPARRAEAATVPVPALAAGERNQSTTMVFVQLLAQLLKDETIGPRVVPIVADEARTFGMQTLFRQAGIYSAVGQLYEPEDHEELLYYREAKDGQILEEGITEAGALSSWLAAATSYSTHGLAMLPFYIYYSVFGFQRVGDLIWAAGDSQTRGFLVGGTAGRTTLAGEGLQHQDGHSQLLASTVPNCIAYDPAFAYELAVVIQDGLRRMFAVQEDVFLYITAMNENYTHPAMPKGAEQGILKGMYLLRAGGRGKVRVNLFGSGTILREVMTAAEILERDYGVPADIFSATSYSELRREALDVERRNLLHPDQPAQQPYVRQLLGERTGPFIAASDYMKIVPDQIRQWVPGRFTVLGTDGYGRSDSRAQLRRHFEVDAQHIVLASLRSLADEGKLDMATVKSAMKKFDIDPERPNPVTQ